MSSVPSMNAYVACHACHTETPPSHPLSVPNGPGNVNKECAHTPRTKRRAEEEHVQQGGLWRQALGQAWHSVTTTKTTEESQCTSLNSPLFARISLRIRNFSGGSDSSDK